MSYRDDRYDGYRGGSMQSQSYEQHPPRDSRERDRYEMESRRSRSRDATTRPLPPAPRGLDGYDPSLPPPKYTDSGYSSQADYDMRSRGSDVRRDQPNGYDSQRQSSQYDSVGYLPDRRPSYDDAYPSYGERLASQQLPLEDGYYRGQPRGDSRDRAPSSGYRAESNSYNSTSAYPSLQDRPSYDREYRENNGYDDYAYHSQERRRSDDYRDSYRDPAPAVPPASYPSRDYNERSPPPYQYRDYDDSRDRSQRAYHPREYPPADLDLDRERERDRSYSVGGSQYQDRYGSQYDDPYYGNGGDNYGTSTSNSIRDSQPYRDDRSQERYRDDRGDRERSYGRPREPESFNERPPPASRSQRTLSAKPAQPNQPPGRTITLEELRRDKEKNLKRSLSSGGDGDGTENPEAKKIKVEGGGDGEASGPPSMQDLSTLTAEELVMAILSQENSQQGPSESNSQREIYTMKPELDGKRPEFHERTLELPEGVSEEKAAKLTQAYNSRVQLSERARQRETERDQGKTKSRAMTACRFELNGRCTSGKDCEWSHDPDILAEARIANERLPDVCKYFKVGKCERGAECEFSHELKHEPCKFFHWFGTCQAGDRCEYSHSKLNERQQQWIQNQMKKRLKMQACRFYFKGKCKKSAEECAFSHEALTPDQEVRLHKDLEDERRRAWREGKRAAGTKAHERLSRRDEGPYVPGL